MKKYTRKPEREELERLYVDEQKTLKDIGNIFNTSGATILNWLKANKIPKRTMAESWNLRRDKYCDTFDRLEGVDCEETIKRFGYDPATLSRKSRKCIVVVCPTCGDVREVGANGYKNGQLCRSCSKMGENHPIFGGHSAMLGRHHTEESKHQISESRIGKCVGEDNHNYTGGRHDSYCNLWTEPLRESIRESFGRVCFLCGKTEEENNRKLDVHHTNSGKMCMCSYDCQLVPLCRSCHTKTIHDRFYWYSVIMCKLYLVPSSEFFDSESCIL